jgi:hypothetical protein
MDPTEAYFSEHYAPRILDAITAGHSFVVGPIRGIDTLALHFLLAQDVPASKISVYMAEFEYNNVKWRQGYEELGVHVVLAVPGTTTGERDAAMTRASDYDILRYRTEDEARELYGTSWWPRVTNTEMNERRRAALREGKTPVRTYVRHAAGIQMDEERDEKAEDPVCCEIC